MPAAAIQFAPTSHPGLVITGCATVLIGGLPAARRGDDHTCLLPPLAGPHPPNKVIAGSATVLIGGLGAARQGDLTGCGASILVGVPTVQIGG